MTVNQGKMDVYPTAVERNALWLYDKLHVDNLSDKCQANIVDTILFSDYPQPHPSKWLFTNKAGFICRKKEENMSFGNVYFIKYKFIDSFKISRNPFRIKQCNTQ